jgi:signal transduction histidine kinase/ActR/RegA family two-component response regulator
MAPHPPTPKQRVVAPLRVVAATVLPLYVAVGLYLEVSGPLAVALGAFGAIYAAFAIVPTRWMTPLANPWAIALTVVWCTGTFAFGPLGVGLGTVTAIALPAIAPLPARYRTVQILIYLPLFIHADASGATLLSLALFLGWIISWRRYRVWTDLLDIDDTLAGVKLSLTQATTVPPAGRRQASPISVTQTSDVENLESLERHERLASLGRLAIGVGHEINNPLTVAMMNVELLIAERPDELLRETQDALLRIRAIVSDLAGLARPADQPGASQPLNDLVEKCVEIVRMGLRTSLRIELVELKNTPVQSQPSRLEQVLVNLLVNASQAIAAHGSGGTARISMEKDTGRVYLHVDDDGPGIPEDAFEQVFQPFYTTKPIGEGTGLGLALARDYMRDMGGDLVASKSPSGGARFTLVMQRASADIPTGPIKKKSPAPTIPSLQVKPGEQRPLLLVIDDDRALRRSLARSLANTWDVALVGNSVEARRVLTEQEVGAVLCDLHLGAEDALDVLGLIERVHPDLVAHTLLMTGAPQSGAMSSLASKNAQWLVRKPFRMDALRTALGEALHGHEGIDTNIDPNAPLHSLTSLPSWAARPSRTDQS